MLLGPGPYFCPSTEATPRRRLKPLRFLLDQIGDVPFDGLHFFSQKDFHLEYSPGASRVLPPPSLIYLVWFSFRITKNVRRALLYIFTFPFSFSPPFSSSTTKLLFFVPSDDGPYTKTPVYLFFTDCRILGSASHAQCPPIFPSFPRRLENPFASPDMDLNPRCRYTLFVFRLHPPRFRLHAPLRILTFQHFFSFLSLPPQFPLTLRSFS